MALQPTRMEFRLTLSNTDAGTEANETLIVPRHPSETQERVVLRVLAWCLLHREGLEAGDAMTDPDVPDLSTRDLTGRLTTWIRVGAIAGDRLKKALQHNAGAEVHVVLADPRKERELDEEIASWKKPPEGLTIWRVDPQLVATLAANEDRRQKWTVTVVEGHLYVEANGITADGEVTAAG